MIHPQHLREWQASCVNDEIIQLNVESPGSYEVYGYLIPNIDVASGKVHPDAQWRWATKKYSHIEDGGWWCGTLDPVTLEKSLWGCFKPDNPRPDFNKPGKVIKYEHPPKMPTEVFCLGVPLHTWQQIAERYGQSVDTPGNKEIDIWGMGTGGYGRSFYSWVQTNPEIPIVITEGAKTVGAILTAGYVGIGLPGIFGGYRTPQDDQERLAGMRYLIDQVKIFAQKGRQVYFAFDQDSKYETRQNVANAIEQTGNLLTRLGCEVKVMQWQGESGKGADDLIANLGVSAFDAAYNQALPLANWKVARLSELTYLPNIQINRRYLDKLAIPESTKLVAIKSAKGTGKTEFVVGEVEKAHANGQRVLVLTHRVQLGEALCNRFGIPYVTEVRESETGDLLGYGLCVDSLHGQSQARFNPNNWHDAAIIIDESEQVFWHLLNASTEVQKHRVTILRNLKTLVQNVLSSKTGRIYLADADLSDLSINYVKSLAGFYVEPFIIRNDWQPMAGNAYIYPEKDPRALVAALEKHVTEGGKAIVCCSGQQAKSKWGTQTLERRFRSQFPGLKILRIDSQTVADPTHPAYGVIAKLNETLPQYDIVLASPSIETGVSIDIKGHFTSVWCIAQGVQPENSVRQALARLREPVDRHIWASPVGLRGAKIGNGAMTPGALLRSQHSQTKANITLLSAADHNEEFQIDENFQPESLRTWAKKACIINLGMMRYQEAILEGLVADGYKISFVNPDDDGGGLVEELTTIRDQAYQEECLAIATSATCSTSELKAIKDKRAKTTEERHIERKADLAERYSVEVTDDLVAKDDEGWYGKLRLHYYITIGRVFLTARDQRRAKTQVESGESAIWKPDFNKGQLLPAVKLLEALGVPGLMTPGKQFKGSDLEVEQLAELAKQHRQVIKDYLGLTISLKDTPIAIAQKLLGKLGLKLTFVGRFGSRGNQQRVYTFELPTDKRDNVMQKWLERDVVTSSVATSGNKEVNTSNVATLTKAC